LRADGDGGSSTLLHDQVILDLRHTGWSRAKRKRIGAKSRLLFGEAIVHEATGEAKPPCCELRFRYWRARGLGLALLLGRVLRSRRDHRFDLLRDGGFGRGLIFVHMKHLRVKAALICRIF